MLEIKTVIVSLSTVAYGALERHAAQDGLTVEEQAAKFIYQGMWVEDGYNLTTGECPIILMLPIHALSDLTDIARSQLRHLEDLAGEAFRIGYETIVEPYSSARSVED